MPAGVVDLFMMPGCKPKPRQFFSEEKTKERNTKMKRDEEDKTKMKCKDQKKVNYDEWKKQVLDNVKAPSFNTSDGMAAEDTPHKSGGGPHVISSQRNHPSTYQMQETRDRSTFTSTDPPDFKAASTSQPQFQGSRYQGTEQERRSAVENEELNLLRSEHQSLRKAREELQSELESFKRHNREIVKTTAGTSRSVCSEMDYKEMMVNQKFNDVMRIASPNGPMNYAYANNLTRGDAYNSSRVSNDWNSHVMSPSGRTHLPSSPMVVDGNKMWSSPTTNMNSQAYHNDNIPLHHGLGRHNQGVLRSPASMTSGSHNMYHGFDENSHQMSHGWTGVGECQNWVHGRKKSASSDRCEDNSEDLLNEMKLKSALMEADLMRMKESMSPRFQPMSSHAYGSATVTTPSGNGILKPSAYNNFGEMSSHAYGSATVTTPSGNGILKPSAYNNFGERSTFQYQGLGL
jgi:hypothetical protein